MSPDLYAVLESLKPVAASMVFGGGLVLSQKLGSAQEAMRRYGSQKRVSIESHIPEAQLSRKVTASADAVLNLRDIDKLPVPVQQTFHWLEVLRLGIPEEAKQTAKAVRVFKRVQQRRSA
jgi:hypothetical protein